MHITIYGSSLAAFMCALALEKSVGKVNKLSLIVPSQACASDVLLGGMNGPQAYEFFRTIGISEPELMLHTNTSFSLGAHYQHWTSKKLSWVQTYNLPLSIIEGIELHQLLLKSKLALQDYLVGAQAALKGRFAHPPESQTEHPLSRAEYGYHIDHQSLRELLLAKLSHSTIKLVNADVKRINRQSRGIQSLILNDDTEHLADLFIDATGTDASLLSNISPDRVPDFNVTAKKHIEFESMPMTKAPSPCANLSGKQTQWYMEVPLKNKIHKLSVSEKTNQHSDSNNALKNTITVDFGSREQAWVGNCLAIGHASAVLSPHSSAPYRLLMLDIQRLLSLIPINEDMSMESKEYNRRFTQDLLHASVFSDALFDVRQALDSKVTPSKAWHEEMSFDNQISALLNRKIEQFLNRGLLVNYDLEPFNKEDWTILHMGMQRTPRFIDNLAHNTDENMYLPVLSKIKTAIDGVTSKMPPCHIYTQKFIEYLKKKS
jgi:tryptophan halogenase